MRLTGTVILFLFMLSSNAQQVTYEYIDSLSFVQYRNKQRTPLEHTVDIALKHSIDFYYLRMRVGVLDYESRNYEKAIPHFVRALEMSPVDTIAQEYLYYAFVFTNRTSEADLLMQKMPQDLKSKIGVNPKKLDLFSAETGLAFSNNISSHNDKATNADLTENKEYVYNGGIFYTKLFFQHKISPRFSLQNSLTVYRSQSLTMVNTPNGAQPYEYGNTHFQYNGGFSYAYDKGWKLSGGLGFYHINFTNIVPHQQKAPPMGLPPGPPSFAPEHSSKNYFSGSVSLSKRLKYWEPFVSLASTNMYGTTQYQGETGLTLYPFGNTRFYLVGQAAYLMNKTKNDYVITGKIGGSISKHLFYEGSAVFGNLNNYLANNGFVTYNSFDVIRMNLGFDLGFRVKKVSIIPSYRFQQKQGKVTSANPDVGTRYYTYNNQFLILTVQWKF